MLYNISVVIIVGKKLNIVNDKVGYDQFYDLPKRNRKGEFKIEIPNYKYSFICIDCYIIVTFRR